jgi:hypothetical protein
VLPSTRRCATNDTQLVTGGQEAIGGGPRLSREFRRSCPRHGFKDREEQGTDAA